VTKFALADTTVLKSGIVILTYELTKDQKRREAP
jgi:hypothetical protein